jgi:CDP-diacylglycerol--glycerol-3-phosphate 3-phosphatidyltransferase
VVEPMAVALLNLGLTPNRMTVLGLGFSVATAVCLAYGQITAGGLILLLSGPFDALDGAMARLSGRVTKFGGFLDSVTDRWSEMVVLLGLLYFYLQHGQPGPVLLAFIASMGSVMVSYTKARAEGLGLECKIGLLSRVERYLVFSVLLTLNQPLLALWIVAVLANATALQRMWHVWRVSEGK